MQRLPRTYWKKAVTALLVVQLLLLNGFSADPLCVYADEPNTQQTPTATPTPEDLGGEMDDDDI